jgi:outer membrane protein TolC
MRKEIAFYVFSQYLYILEAQKDLDIQLDNLELQQRIYDQVQVQYDSGEKALLDLKQSEISLIDYEIAVNEAENSLIQQRQDLFTYLNISDEGYDFIEPEFDISEEEFVYQENYTLIQKRNSIKSSKISLFQQKVDFLPSLTFSFYYQNSSLSDEIDDFSAYDDSYTLSLAASFDIFDLFEKRESFVRSRRNLEIEELDLENSEQELRSELSNLINDMKTLRRSRDLYLDKLNLAEENLSMAQEQFRLGIISLLDLDRTKIEYQNAQLSYNNRYYELIRKQEDINKTLSRPILNRW